MKLVTALLLLQVASLAFALPFFDRGEMGWNMKGEGNEFFAMFKFPDGTWNLRMMRMFLNMIKSMDLNTRSDWFKNLYSTEGENDVVEPESYEEPEFVEFIDQPKVRNFLFWLVINNMLNLQKNIFVKSIFKSFKRRVFIIRCIEI